MGSGAGRLAGSYWHQPRERVEPCEAPIYSDYYDAMEGREPRQSDFGSKSLTAFVYRNLAARWEIQGYHYINSSYSGFIGLQDSTIGLDHIWGQGQSQKAGPDVSGKILRR